MKIAVLEGTRGIGRQRAGIEWTSLELFALKGNQASQRLNPRVPAILSKVTEAAISRWQ